MSNDFKDIPTSELERMWDQKRMSIRTGEHFREDMDAVYAMRRELDRRMGNTNPSVFVNFEKDLTD